MAKIAAPAESIVRIHGRGALLSILEKALILTRVKVLDDGRFLTETEDRNSYWKPLLELDNSEPKEALDELHTAWCNYIHSGFNPALRREFCFRYFLLLDGVLSRFRIASAHNSRVGALQATLGFECFGITPATSQEVLGAGTCTLRNPCYLLAKLRMPDVLDDPQFLPIITAPGLGTPWFFYHYRQYALSIDSPMSLMFYPAVSETKRSASFRLVNSLAGGVSYSIDPRTSERAQRLCQGIIRPIIEANKLSKPETACIELVDIGAGSGSLTSSICRELQDVPASTGSHPKFRLWFVDLEPSDPARFFRAKKLRGLADSLTSLGNDYRDWLSHPHPLPPANELRIALVSRLFNNLSCFHIRQLSEEESHLVLENRSASMNLEIHLPSVCLAPGSDGEESLLVSNTRIALYEGRTLAQASLSRYYAGLLVLRMTNAADVPSDGLFLPVRAFNPDCLLTIDGKSVISRLAENCHYVVVEDADLRQQDLIDHMKIFSLFSIVV